MKQAQTFITCGINFYYRQFLLLIDLLNDTYAL